MKKLLLFILALWGYCAVAFATEPLHFAFFTDLHISTQKPQNTEDLQRAVAEVNRDSTLTFVLVAGDDSDLGDTVSLRLAKKLLDSLKIPYYITSGNHDTRQGEIGSANFLKVFGTDRFAFVRNGYCFIGFPTGPVQIGGQGHITADDLEYVKQQLEKYKGLPIFLVTHYPLLQGDVDNREDLLKILPDYSVKAVLNGHYHRNAVFSYNGILGIVNRSTLRAGQPSGGYSVYTLSNDWLKVEEKIIGQPAREWLNIELTSQ